MSVVSNKSTLNNIIKEVSVRANINNTALSNIKNPDIKLNKDSDIGIKHFNKEKIGFFNLKSLVDKVNKKFSLLNLDTKIELQLDKASKEIVVKIIDKNTGKVIRQIPPEEILKIDSAFKDIIRGNLVNKKV